MLKESCGTLKKRMLDLLPLPSPWVTRVKLKNNLEIRGAVGMETM